MNNYLDLGYNQFLDRTYTRLTNSTYETYSALEFDGRFEGFSWDKGAGGEIKLGGSGNNYGRFIVKDVQDNNIIEIDNKGISLSGTGLFEMKDNATVWDDLRVPVTSIKTGGVHDPGFALFIKNGASVGVYAYHFDKTTEEELFFSCQMPHTYKLGTTIHPHVHWSVITAPAGGTTVRWGLEYTVVDIDGTFSAPVIVYTTATDPVTQYKHLLNEFTDISGTALKSVSSMFLCRIFRDVANDNFDADAALLEIDFHFEQDTLGSKDEYLK